MKKVVAVLCLFTVMLLSEEVAMDKLLNQYRIENDLSEQTKQENEGQLTIFTRQDLERMQAYRLSDVLKTIKSFTYQNSVDGTPVMVNYTAQAFDSALVRLSINDHDIASLFYGSAVSVWG